VLRAATVLVVNEIEIAMLAAQLGIPEGSPEAQGRALSTRLGTRVCVSLGPEGALAIGGPLAWRAGVLPITPVDTTGAGDAFVGALAVSLDEGHILPEALRFASVAGGLTCLKPGAAPAMPTRAEIETQLGALAAPEAL
jgi:ribokinase